MVGMYQNLNDISVASGFVTSEDGTQIGYVRAGEGPALILVHGSLQSADDWRRIVPHLAKHFTCYVMDRRGRGLSGDAPDYTMEKERQDLSALLQVAGENTFVFGHSYGGICTLETAREITIKKMVIYEPPLPVHSSVTAHGLDEYKAAVERDQYEEALLTGLSQFLRMSEESIAIFRSSRGWQRTVDMTPTWTREIDVVHALEIGIERFAQIRSPVLLLSSSNSHSHHIEPVDALHQALPDTSRLILPEHGHNAHLTAPQYLSEIVRKYLMG